MTTDEIFADRFASVRRRVATTPSSSSVSCSTGRRCSRSGGLGVAPVSHDEAEARAYLAKEP